MQWLPLFIDFSIFNPCFSPILLVGTDKETCLAWPPNANPPLESSAWSAGDGGSHPGHDLVEYLLIIESLRHLVVNYAFQVLLELLIDRPCLLDELRVGPLTLLELIEVLCGPPASNRCPPSSSPYLLLLLDASRKISHRILHNRVVIEKC
jgi:hypothetical protein